MRLLLSGARVFKQGELFVSDVAIDGGLIENVAPHISPADFDSVIDLSTGYLFPGLVDVHVHLREPGFSCRETIKTGTMAAARGGYTTVCAMPNLIPAPDTLAHLGEQLAIIARDAAVKIIPYGTITMGQLGTGTLSDFAAMKDLVCGLSDDGRGVQDESLMREAMLKAKSLGMMIVAHCEDDRELVAGSAVHDGAAAKKFGIGGINSKSEWAMVERDLRLAKETGCKYHVCHVSTKESVALIREAKADGVDVTCETAPHYLILTDDDLKDEGRFKMNPPIRATEDRAALIEGIMDGTIDMIATDHAPHTQEDKAGGLQCKMMGVVGIETAFALMYAHFVATGRMTLEKLIELMATAPRRRFGLPGAEIEVGQPADLVAFDLDAKYRIDPAEFLSMGKATPFEGTTSQGKTLLTLVNGCTAYRAKEVEDR